MIKFIYKKIIRPILFKFSADAVHVFFLKLGKFLGEGNCFKSLSKKFFLYKNLKLKQEVTGLTFENPIGLAAGFDYDADLIDIIPSVGFGHQTIGTITFLAYGGNPKPMLDRLPKSKSLLVNKGFKNSGIEKILEKTNKKQKEIPLGISIGATNKLFEDINDMTADIISSFQKTLEKNYFDYFELNISCPNLINKENLKEKFDTPTGLSLLLKELAKLPINKPLFIKMPSELKVEKILTLAEIASGYKFIDGLIFSNLVKDRTNLVFDKKEIEKAGPGSFSGKPVEKLSNILISEVYKKYQDRFTIIGCGGIFNGADAYEKIKRGATLVQIITGIIYEGPSQIKKINKELVKLLEKDGYKNISEAVGVYNMPPS